MTKRLTRPQHIVWGFGSGDELLAAADQRGFDQILPDIKMPGRTGLETSAICKNIIEVPHGDSHSTSQVGVGTTVSRWLPLSQAPQPAHQALSATTIGPPATVAAKQPCPKRCHGILSAEQGIRYPAAEHQCREHRAIGCRDIIRTRVSIASRRSPLAKANMSVVPRFFEGLRVPTLPHNCGWPHCARRGNPAICLQTIELLQRTIS